MLPLVPPETFMRLAIPIKGDPQHQHAESVIHLGSRSAAEHPTVTWPVTWRQPSATTNDVAVSTADAETASSQSATCYAPIPRGH